MVATARRAAHADDEALVELPTPAAPRRGAHRAASRGLRLALAPVTALAVVGLVAGATLLPLEKGRVERADPDFAAVTPTFTPERPLATSRSLPRAPLTEATAPWTEPVPTATAVSEPSDEAKDESKKADKKAAAKKKTDAKAAEEKADTKAEKAKESSAEEPGDEKPEESQDFDELGDEDGKRYAESGLNVRVGPGTEYDVRTTVGAGEQLVITDRTEDGWRQVVWKKRAGWVKASYLTKTKPEAREESADKGSGSKDSGYSSASCPQAGGLEKNLTSRATSVLRAVCAKFPSVKSYGGYRAGDDGYHGSGRAIDVMISGDAGWEIAKWARANAGSLGIIEVIYEQKIWTTQRSGDGWRSMSDRGGATANHYDHVHLSIR